MSHVVRPPARRLRIAGLVLSCCAVGFAVGFGLQARKALDAGIETDAFVRELTEALVLLLVALLFRMFASICELFWIERTWSNLPEELRVVGPIQNVGAGLVVGLSFVPGLAWLWKLGVVVGIADGLEKLRASYPFRAPVPRALGTVAVIVGWIPILNVYVAPFLWELFAMRIEAVTRELIVATRREP